MCMCLCLGFLWVLQFLQHQKHECSLTLVSVSLTKARRFDLVLTNETVPIMCSVPLRYCDKTHCMFSISNLR